MKETKWFARMAAGVSLIALTALTACNPGDLPTNVIGTPDNAGAQKASITGTIVKSDSSAAKNATMVIIQKVSGTDKDIQIVRSDSNGIYRFSDLPAGQYRLAFVLQSEQERKDGTTKYYDPTNDEQSAKYFGFITTATFEYDGNTDTAYQVPQMNVGWESALSPHDESVSASSPIKFSWNAAEGATGYTVDIRDSSNNPFYKASVKTNSFTWSDMKGNQGNNSGKTVSAGQTYYYLIAASLDRSNSGDGPTPTYGGTALAKFTTK